MRSTRDGHLANTHLVIRDPQGQKFDAARKWRLPAVTKQCVRVGGKKKGLRVFCRWLLRCALSGTRQEESAFLAENVEKEAQTSDPSASCSAPNPALAVDPATPKAPPVLEKASTDSALMGVTPLNSRVQARPSSATRERDDPSL